MIVVHKPNVQKEKQEQLVEWLKNQGLGVHVSNGEYQTVLGLIGDTSSVDMELIASLDTVDTVKRVSEPFKRANRKFHPVDTLGRVKELLKPAGFGSITVTTAEKNDEIIAFTSQLAHNVSSAYIKSPTSRKHSGVSAGSYRDMTRVAWLNPRMWAELFLDNRDTLIKLLDDGRRIKEEVDGK